MQKFMAFCLLVSFLVFPVSATGSEYVSRDTFWTWAAGSNGVIKQVINFVGGLGTCSKSDDTYHHASSYFKEGNVDGEVRYRCICDLCGDAFTAYKSDLQQSYEAQVEELPAQGITSAGKLIWQPSFNDIDLDSSKLLYVFDNSTSYAQVLCSDLPFSTVVDKSSNRSIKLSENTSSNGYNFYWSNISAHRCGMRASFFVPLSGSYRYFGSARIFYRGLSLSGEMISGSINYGIGSFTHYSSGDFIKFNSSFDGPSGSFSFLFISAFLPVFEVVPDSTIDVTSGDTYNIQSRPTSITGDYGIIGDNGQIIKVEGDKIVNETNNTIYNPATGETHTLSDWSYNYTDRSYTVTTETGDTITITYGDENVVIKEGDTTYNIYYLVNGSGSENPGPDIPDVCDHAWTETSRTDPTCSTAGKVSSVCSKCGQVKTEPLPATGHTWVVDRTVQTTYDEEGNLLQQGYTIYSCSVCGEQYKDMEGTGPPGAEEEKSIWEKIGDLLGSGFSGIIEIIEAILSKILDALTSLVDMLMDKLKHIVESVLSIFDEVPALFGGFLDFLGAIFPFLPPEITTILTFGVIAITFIGILKAVRR